MEQLLAYFSLASKVEGYSGISRVKKKKLYTGLGVMKITFINHFNLDREEDRNNSFDRLMYPGKKYYLFS